MKVITISEREYKKLLERDLWLNCLEQAGVDNWQGIDMAYELKEEYEKEEKEGEGNG